MNKKATLRGKLSLDKQTIRRLDPASLATVAGAKPNTTFVSVLLQCSWYCVTASCFVDDTCGMHGCGSFQG